MSSAFWLAVSTLAGRVHFPDARAALAEGLPPPYPALLLVGFSPAQAAVLADPPLATCAHDRVSLLDEDWPEGLDHVPKAPGVLFLRGDRGLLRAPRLAIVGSRHCSPTGVRMAQRLAREVAERGGVVVSGLAYGIDEAAHLAAPARTIAVLGQGLDRPLTLRQQQVQERILSAGGLVLSELAPDAPATRWTFPQRNRIIAGLARATIVVEAARRSGALITARMAMELGRDVLAVPGSPLDPMSEGCLELIASGAGLARDGGDLGPYLPCASGSNRSPGPAHGPGLPEAGLRVLLRGVDVEGFAQALGWPVPQATGVLTALELTGQVQRLPGERFSLRDPG